MIIQIRGTSGSGKTWVTKQVISQLGDPVHHYREGRKLPLWSQYGDVGVLGHYETNCGGCDSIGSAAKVYELIQEAQKTVHHILCEGLLLSEDVKWSSQLTDLHVLFLITDIEQCIQQVKSRRLSTGNEKELNEANTRKRVAVVERARIRLEALSIPCRRVSAVQAPELILKKLGR